MPGGSLAKTEARLPPSRMASHYGQPHGILEAMLPVSVRGCFDEAVGIWVWAARPAASEPRPALFLDRDGVIVEDPGYLCRPGDLRMIGGATTLIASANRRGIAVVEVTNQAGIGRGYYTWQEFAAVEEALTRMLADSGAYVDAILACPYHREGVAPWAHPTHPARKPSPGMLFAAKKLLNLDLRASWIVGDKLSDLEAGYHARLRGGLHVLTGKGSHHRPAVAQWKPENFDLRLGESIGDAEGLPW
jgi:D-glycero-D-manno-heptose 1,7-bisphosphate phosphatase